ncbi:hypothetical protein C480_10145 [Natrialba aegyptia DSM 13077]|uniref:DUF4352 domain-containing protein n=2 Tax=Natrialba aegyptia TaxID=129789 RepID=M0B4J8_9EURY|nr:hypothetical protein C480_10145 [Natrialba aegyptia DSM 13077]
MFGLAYIFITFRDTILNMNRRAYLTAATVSTSALIAGCSQVEELASNVGEETTLGDTVSFGNIDITVTDSMTTGKITLNGNEKTAPSNGIYALFEVEAHNTDVTERDVPYVSIPEYETLEKEEDVIYFNDINDIRVYGSGEGGHFPDLDWQEEMQVNTGYELGANGEQLETYPAGRSRPSIDADSTITGWGVGVIDTGATPELRINFGGKSETWKTDD